MRSQPPSPGEILREEFLIPMGLSQSAFARHIGWNQPKVNEIITGKRGITPETAMVLSNANAQQAVDLFKAQRKHKTVKKLSQIASIL
jgi:addiction module HigA family antidote